jgi:hypothetical protein
MRICLFFGALKFGEMMRCFCASCIFFFLINILSLFLETCLINAIIYIKRSYITINVTMSLFYVHLMTLNNRYTLREGRDLNTYRYINSLVITKIRKVKNFKNIFYGQLCDTLRGRINRDSWEFSFLPHELDPILMRTIRSPS